MIVLGMIVDGKDMDNLKLIRLFKDEIKHHYFIEKFIINLIKLNKSSYIDIKYIMESYDRIKRNKNILTKHGLNIFESKNFEDLNDKIDIIIDDHNLHHLIFSNISKKHHDFIDEDIKKLFLPLIHHEEAKDVFKQIFKKIALYKNRETFKVYIIEEISRLSSFSIESIKKDISDTNATIINQSENKILVEISSYEDSFALGSKKWCISYNENMYESYKSRDMCASVYNVHFNKMLFLYDFNRSISDPSRLIGYTLSSNGKIQYAMDYNDIPTSDNLLFFKKYKDLVKFEKIEDRDNRFLFENNILNKRPSKNKNIKAEIDKIKKTYSEHYLDRYIKINNFKDFKEFNIVDLKFSDFMELKFNNYNDFLMSYQYFKKTPLDFSIKRLISIVKNALNKKDKIEIKKDKIEIAKLPDILLSCVDNFTHKYNIPGHIYDNIVYLINTESIEVQSDKDTLFSLLEKSDININSKLFNIEKENKIIYQKHDKNIVNFLDNRNIIYEKVVFCELLLELDVDNIINILKIGDKFLAQRNILILKVFLRNMQNLGEKLIVENIRRYGDMDMVKLRGEKDPELLSFLLTNPGFDPAKTKQDQKTFEQYGYNFMGILNILEDHDKTYLKINLK